MDQVVNDGPEACWLCVKYNLEIDGRVASGCTIPVMTISGSKTRSHRRRAGEPVFGKYIPMASSAQLICWLVLQSSTGNADKSLSLAGRIEGRLFRSRSGFSWESERSAGPEFGHATHNTIRLFCVNACVSG